MSVKARIGGLALAASAAAAAIVAIPVTSAEAGDRQSAFSDAADEFGVPEDVLLALSYLESRWQDHSGQPSMTAGYGPMHLTDAREVRATAEREAAEDPRGDAARPLHGRAEGTARSSEAAEDPALNTIRAASKLVGVDVATLRTDPAQNIRGGAALLAEYQKDIAPGADSPSDWYGAVAKYSGSEDTASARVFADEVFGTLSSGIARATDAGEVTLAGEPDVAPNRSQLGRLGLRAVSSEGTECPAGIACESLPAPYEKLDGGGYGNHDKADRPNDLKIDKIVIHDTEATYADSVKLAQDPTYLAWNYTVRSSDGHVAQHVATKDVGWHAGNWDVNTRSIGVEHEGFAAEGTWYTESMYRASATLVRYLADRYDIPLDRQHVIGHGNVPGQTQDKIADMHWDPGPYWDWSHYFELLGAPLAGERGTDPNSKVVTVLPDFDTNKPAFTGCDAEHPKQQCPARSSSAVVLRTEPKADAPLLKDIGQHPDGSASTMDVADVGSRVGTGQRYAVAQRRGDWTGIYYLGQVGWLRTKDTVAATGQVVTPKQGKETVPVYGQALPEESAYPDGVDPTKIEPLKYTLRAGQRYVAGPEQPSQYYSATTFDASKHVVVRGETSYVQIQYGHRIAYVDASDVDVTAA